MKGKTGLVVTETGQAEVEIPKEKDAKHSTVSSRNREICGTQAGAGAGNMMQSWLYGKRKWARGYIFLDVKFKNFKHAE